ncbi:dihydropteroate synthase [Gayadomonas joobiniege]|uniref:dihydropteroate synthase n=1 Tax=Gayadomonas joobiniege TaxID=1234606 RepID=UPI00035CE096|nr:dihydropteroate synthase [Gayadomonas joobiniege]
MKITNLLNQKKRPLLMGILNVTPDSFSDGGRYNHIHSALKQAEQMITDGADILDIGGESTRPGATFVPVKEELARVLPILKAVKQNFSVPVSIDTYKAEVMRAVIAEGADLINDVKALTEPDALAAVANTNVDLCLMHMRGTPQTMQKNTQYEQGVLVEVKNFFKQRIIACQQAGIARERLLLDPGFGFGKSQTDNFKMLAEFASFKEFELPLLAGISRKSMLNAVAPAEPAQRVYSSICAATIAMLQGAQIIRVHDVAASADAIAVTVATLKEKN